MRVELVMLGGSWGGAAAAGRVLQGLDAGFGAPVVAVFHRQAGSDEDALSRSLARRSPLPVCDADDKDDLVPGRVLVAPAGYHLLVEPGAVALSTEAAVHYSRPSIDVAFDTAARAYGDRVAGVVLTGANADGSFGLARIKEAGGRAFVQDPETAERREMPVAAIAATRVDAVAAPEEIGTLLRELCAGASRCLPRSCSSTTGERTCWPTKPCSPGWTAGSSRRPPAPRRSSSCSRATTSR